MTALTGIYLRNFQSVKNPTFIKLDGLCFLYGPNSAGKSSILDALDLVKKTVTGDAGKYRLESVYSRHRNKNDDLGVGIEAISPIKNEFISHDQAGSREWWETPDQRGDFFHQNFFAAVKGKKFQVEFGGYGNSIKIAVEGRPLFEFDTDSVEYNDFYNKLSPEEIETGEFLSGRIIIYKKNKLNENYDYGYSDFFSKRVDAYLPISPHFRELFVEEDDEKLIIYGLRFDPGRDFQTNIVNVDISVDDIIFPKYKSLKKYRSDDVEYQKFVEEHFNEATEVGKKSSESRKRIYWSLEDIARDFDKLLKGFFFEIDYAIENFHVRGDRQILNSENCFSYPRHKNIELKNCNLAEDDPMSEYAKYITDPDSYYLSKVSIKGDFVNKALKDYLISLRGYEIYPEIQELIKTETDFFSGGKFIYLKVKHNHRDNLGFQDVGSGISYVFPILASLWASKLTFVEQPELHLHPSAQCELGDVFIAAYNKGSMSVVESHSEHMLLRILRRIRETTKDCLLPKELKFSARDLRIYYFKPEIDGYTSVKEIRVDDQGELLNSWPGGFFSERDRELFDE
jgi:AAA ATPase domain